MRKEANLQTVGKFIAGIILFLITGVILVNYLIKSSQRSISPPVKSKSINQRSELKEQVVHFELKGEKGNFELKGNKHYWGEDKKYHLEGSVEIKIYPSREGEEEVIISAEQAIYNKKMTNFLLKKRVKFKQGNLILKSESMRFNKLNNVIRTSEKVSFFYGETVGTSGNLNYFLEEELLKLGKKVKLRIKRKGDPRPIYLQGNNLEYNRKKKKGTLKGNIFLFQNLNSFKSNYLIFELNQEENKLKSLYLEGKAEGIMANEENEISPGLKSESQVRSIKKLKAERIFLSISERDNKISSLTGKDNCQLEIYSSPNSHRLILAQEIKLFLSSSQQLTKFEAKGNVIIKESGGEKREITGEKIIEDREKELLVISGKQNTSASITSADNQLLAEEITIFLKNGDLKAKEVKYILFPDSEKRNPIGFFSPEELIFISAQEMVYLAEKEVTIFSGNTKLWQKNDFITAQKISINHKETQLHAQGEVKSFFHHKIKNQEELIKIYAAKMEFSQKEKLITYQGNNSLFAKNLKVSAKTIKLLLEKEKSGIEKIIAQQEATIEYSQYRATGGKAEYNLNQEKIILTENPVIIDQNKGRTEGKKLTFHLADDRIVMESEENKRAVTVLSSKTIKEK